MEGPGRYERWWCEIMTIMRWRDCNVFCYVSAATNAKWAVQCTTHPNTHTLLSLPAQRPQRSWPFSPLAACPSLSKQSFFLRGSIQSFYILCQWWLTDSNALSCISDTWQPLGDVIFEDDLWITAISAQIKVIIRVHLLFTGDCAHCNIFSRNIYTVPVWR